MASEQPEDIEITEEGDCRGFQDDLNALANERGRPVLLLNCLMVDESLTAVKDKVKAISVENPTFRKHKQLSVLLKSPGGLATDTYKLILALRAYAEDIEVLVPSYAKSAATLFCLGADTIYMGKEGDLGPLDPQILDRTGSGRRVSALHTFKGLEQLLEHSLEAFNSTVSFIFLNTPMDLSQSMEHANPLIAAIVSPLHQNVDLHELGEAGRYLAESEEYAFRAMQRWGYVDMKADAIRGIARKLVWEYPSHGFVIDLTEAQDIGLNAKPMSDISESFENTAMQIVARLDVKKKFVSWGFPDTEVERDNADCVPSTIEKEENGDANEPK